MYHVHLHGVSVDVSSPSASKLNAVHNLVLSRRDTTRAKHLARMQINSPDVPDLTVVDLPGTTTIPMKNQPQSIVADLENMALHYISDPNSIILAVTPANADVANSQALQLAGRVDPGVWVSYRGVPAVLFNGVGVLECWDIPVSASLCCLRTLVSPLHEPGTLH